MWDDDMSSKEWDELSDRLLALCKEHNPEFYPDLEAAVNHLKTIKADTETYLELLQEGEITFDEAMEEIEALIETAVEVRDKLCEKALARYGTESQTYQNFSSMLN